MGGRAVVCALDKVESRPVGWLWNGRIPMGKLTLLAGDPGLGKSFITLDLAARVSTGVLPSAGSEGGDGGAGDVVILSAEDDPADTIRPRLERMHADLRRVTCVTGMYFEQLPDTHRVHMVKLDRDLRAVAQVIESLDKPRLVVVDPISAYMGERDSHNNAEVRSLLGELARLAAHYNVAVVCVTHLNKGGQGQKAVYRAMGSLAFTAAARVVLLVAKHPDNPSKRVVVPIKSNIGREATGLVYTINDGRLEWLVEPVPFEADALENGDAAEQADALGEAVEWLGAALAGGPRRARDLVGEAEADGISPRTLRRAKRRLGVVSRKERGGGSTPWVWTLGDHEREEAWEDERELEQGQGDQGGPH